MKTIIPVPEKCVGCMICMQACTFFHEKEFNPKRSRIKVTRFPRIGLNVAVVCRQCGKPKCIENCPVEGTLFRDPATEAIRVDPSKCIGCNVCAENCPFGAISMDPITKVATVCDLCGGEPKCVEWCPNNALLYASKAISSQLTRYKQSAKTARTILSRLKIPVNLLKEIE